MGIQYTSTYGSVYDSLTGITRHTTCACLEKIYSFCDGWITMLTHDKEYYINLISCMKKKKKKHVKIKCCRDILE